MNLVRTIRRPTAREKRDHHAAAAAHRAAEIKHHRDRCTEFQARIERQRAAGRDASKAEAALVKAEKTLAAKVRSHAKHQRMVGKLTPHAHRADSIQRTMPAPKLQRSDMRRLTKAEQRAAEKARERQDREVANRKRQMRSVGLDDDLSLVSARRDFEIHDTTKADPNGARLRRKQPPARMFEDYRRHFSNRRVKAIEEFDLVWEGALREAPMPSPIAMERVDISIGPGRTPKSAYYIERRDAVRREIGPLMESLLKARIVDDITWDSIAEESGLSRRHLGRLFVEALNGVIRALGIPDPDAVEERGRIRVAREDEMDQQRSCPAEPASCDSPSLLSSATATPPLDALTGGSIQGGQR